MFTSKISGVDYKFKFEHKRRKRGRDLKTICSVVYGDDEKELSAKTHCIPPDVPNIYIGKMKALENLVQILFPNDKIKRAWVWASFFETFPKPLTVKTQLKNLKRFLRENYPDILQEYLEHRR